MKKIIGILLVLASLTLIVACDKKAEVTDSADWMQAYTEIVEIAYNECDTMIPNMFKDYGRYGLYDFDFDDVPELFVEIYGYASYDHYIRVYDYVKGELVALGEFESPDAWVYGVNEKNAFLYGYTTTKGVNGWNIMRYENGVFESEELVKFDGASSGEPDKAQIVDMGYEVTDITAFDLADPSGIGTEIK